MRIVNIIQRYPPAIGGAETWCQEVCRYLARRGHEVRVLTLNVYHEEEYWRDPLDDEWTTAFGRMAFDQGVMVRRYQRSLPIPHLSRWVYKHLLDRIFQFPVYGPHSGELYGKMWREMRWADVVFLHTLPHSHSLIAFFVAKLLRKKIVIVPHFHPTHPSYERGIFYWLMRKCDVVVTVTDFEKQYLQDRQIAAERLHVTGNGIHPEAYQARDLETFRAALIQRYDIRSEERVLIFIGRKVPEKGIGDLIAAVKVLRLALPLRLFLVGPASEWYTNLYASLSAEEQHVIIDLGVVSHQDKVNLLCLSDLLVLPSQYEAFGIVFLEAWICGLPVIGTQQRAMPSVIGQDGFVSKFGDPADLQRHLKRALADPHTLRRMGLHGQAKVRQHYTWEVIGHKAERAIQAAYGQHERKKTVLIITNSYPPRFVGGAELIAHAQAKVLQQQGYEVIVFAGEVNYEAKRYALSCDTYEGLCVYRVCLHQQDYDAEFLNFYHPHVHKVFAQVLETVMPQVVHFHNLLGLSVGLIRVAKDRALKTVLTLHDYWGFCLKQTRLKTDTVVCQDFSKCDECLPWIHEFPWTGLPIRMRRDFLAWQLEAIDTFIAPSNYLAKTYIQAGLPPAKFKTIWNGIDRDRFQTTPPIPLAPLAPLVPHGSADLPIRFSFIDYVGPHKGVPTILDALAVLGQLGQVLEHVRINIVGEGRERAVYEHEVAKRGWAENVRFWGQIDNRDIDQVYQQTDVLLVPSIWPENQPVTITEAMAAGIPVIASRIGGIPELVDDGRTGYLFEPGNAQELAQKMSSFVADQSKVQQFGEQAARKMADNTLSRQVEKIRAVYEEAVVSTPPAAYRLVVCLGRRVPPDYAQAINQLKAEDKWMNWMSWMGWMGCPGVSLWGSGWMKI